MVVKNSSKKKSAPITENKGHSAGPRTKRSRQKSKSEFVAVPESNEDIDITEADLEFFEENQNFHQFLTNLDSKEISRKPVKKKTNVKKQEKKPTTQEEEDQSPLSDEEDYFVSDDDEDIGKESVAKEDSEADLGDSSDEESIESDVGMDEMMSEADGMEKPVIPRKKRRGGDIEEEMAYEKLPRMIADEWKEKKNMSARLPIKMADGKVIRQEKEQEDDSDSDEEVEIQPKAHKVNSNKEPQTANYLPDSVQKLSKKAHNLHIKEQLASIASTILEDPDKNLGDVKRLRTIYLDADTVLVKKLALLTRLSVFKDVIPGYRIRPLTEIEESAKVSKEVQRLRDYEKELLRYYEIYVDDLKQLLTKNGVASTPDLALVAARCLHDLLVSKPYFNFRLEIMSVLVMNMSTVKWNDISQIGFEAMVSLFEGDEAGNVSLDAVKMITRMIRSKGYVVSDKTIHLFLHLRLRDEMIPQSEESTDENKSKKRKKDQPHLSKKARKTLKENKKIEKEMQEAEAVVSKEEKERNHTETLKLVFALYFRVLKKNITSPLLPAVLEGISSFAHLINVDFFDDLLNAIRDVMTQLDGTQSTFHLGADTRKRLLCITTVYSVFAGRGAGLLNYDLKQYAMEMYKIVFKASLCTDLESKRLDDEEMNSDLFIKTLEMTTQRKRQMPVERLAAFIKRVALAALNMPDKMQLKCLSLIQQLIQRNQRLEGLLQPEDRVGSGVYMPYLDDPDLCNPFGTSLYELFLYQNHYNPHIRNLAKALVATATSKES